MNPRLLTLLFAQFTIAACSGNEPIDLGKQSAANGTSLSEYAGEWRGYVEAYTFADGTDAIRLTLDAEGNGALVVGERDDVPVTDLSSNYVPLDPRAHALVAGFPYPIRDAELAGTRLRMETKPLERYRDWCSRLPPRAYSKYVLPPISGVGGIVWAEGGGGTGGVHGSYETAYSCTELAGKSIGRVSESDPTMCEEYPRTSDQMPTPVPCGTWGCQEYCTCTEQKCSVRERFDEPVCNGGQCTFPVDTGEAVRLDAALRDGGDRLEGTMVLGQERIQARMARP